MKRLIDTNKKPNFKNWVIQHNPELKWNFDDPKGIKDQLVRTIKESGDIDLRTLFEVLFQNVESGLSLKRDRKFLEENY